MGDVLSQAEIDALLEQMAGGGQSDIAVEPAKAEIAARVYDFAHPSKFSKEHLRTLANIFENFSRTVSSFLTGYLRSGVTIEVANYEQVQFKEVSMALYNPVILAMTELTPLKGTVMIELSNSLGYTIIDRILGGEGNSLSAMRDFTEIEAVLLERVFTQMIAHLTDAWANIIELRPRLTRLETNSQFAQIMPPSDMVAFIVLKVKIGNSEGVLNFTLPYLVLESIMDKLKTNFLFTQHDVGDAEMFRMKLEDKLERTFVAVSAVVGKTNIMVTDFVNLQRGDVIKLDSFVNSDLEIRVGNLKKFYARPGTNRGRYAFQISKQIEDQE